MTSILENPSKAYAVIEYGGEWEDKWEHIIGVCSSPELADELKNRTEESHDSTRCAIDEDTWNNMCDALYDYEEEHGMVFDSNLEGLLTLFPKYSVEDLELAENVYDISDYHGVMVIEVDLYM